jgi:hypothetical protein
MLKREKLNIKVHQNYCQLLLEALKVMNMKDINDQEKEKFNSISPQILIKYCAFDF